MTGDRKMEAVIEQQAFDGNAFGKAIAKNVLDIVELNIAGSRAGHISNGLVILPVAILVSYLSVRQNLFRTRRRMVVVEQNVLCPGQPPPLHDLDKIGHESCLADARQALV